MKVPSPMLASRLVAHESGTPQGVNMSAAPYSVRERDEAAAERPVLRIAIPAWTLPFRTRPNRKRPSTRERRDEFERIFEGSMCPDETILALTGRPVGRDARIDTAVYGDAD